MAVRAQNRPAISVSSLPRCATEIGEAEGWHSKRTDESEHAGADLADPVTKVEQTDRETAEDDAVEVIADWQSAALWPGADTKAEHGGGNKVDAREREP